jgi:hypothetical protein
MGLAVVRCTACLGASQVEAEALGLTVRCPRCDSTFTAVEEAEVVQPASVPRNPILPAPEPVAERPRERRRRRPEPDRRGESERRREPSLAPEPDHDPYRIPHGPLPASVLIGLALLPFAIPILWLVAPAITGMEPAMSIATPSALAVSASVLCLAVIYTVDWSATTRIKGVLMLVALAYFAAVNLYFLKKEMVDKFRTFFGMEERVHWQRLKTPDYDVDLPEGGRRVLEQDLPIRSIKLDCHTSQYLKFRQFKYVFVVGSGELPNIGNDDAKVDAWFRTLGTEIVTLSRGKIQGEPVKRRIQGYSGRQYEIRLPQNNIVRLVRVFAVKDRLYYLSVEGLHLSENHDEVRHFFDSFDVPAARQ